MPTTGSWLPMLYREFFGVPRLVVVEFAGDLYLFDSPFDEAADGYAAEFTVRRLPPAAQAVVMDECWDRLEGVGEVVGHVRVDEVEFDDTRRSAVSSRAFELLRLA